MSKQNKSKGFWQRMFEKLDAKMSAAAKNSKSCCCEQDGKAQKSKKSCCKG